MQLATDARIDALEAAVRRLTSQVAELQTRGRGSRATGEDDAQLLAAIALSVGGSVFTVRDLRRLARHGGEMAAALGGASARCIGARLRGLRGRSVAGYQVERLNYRDSRGAHWQLRVCVDSHTPGIPMAMTGA